MKFSDIWTSWEVCHTKSVAYFVIGFFLIADWKFLYILNESTLSDKWFENILSHSVECAFIFFMESFETKFDILMKPNLFFSVLACVLDVIPKKSLSILPQ